MHSHRASVVLASLLKHEDITIISWLIAFVPAIAW